MKELDDRLLRLVEAPPEEQNAGIHDVCLRCGQPCNWITIWVGFEGDKENVSSCCKHEFLYIDDADDQDLQAFLEIWQNSLDPKVRESIEAIDQKFEYREQMGEE